MSMSLLQIPNIIPVLSGKGGVGKSSVTVQLALSLCLRGHHVGVLDIDLTGPSIPRLFGVESAKITQAPGGFLPAEVHPAGVLPSQHAPTAHSDGQDAQRVDGRLGSLHCMSLGFLLQDRGDAVIWRGPKKTAMVKQLLSDVLWPPDTEYLLIDTPPGTSDEHISLVTNLLDPARVRATAKLAAVVVTTPQAVATADVRKELTFCHKTGLKVIGIVENMAGFVCPCCGEVTNVFSKGGGRVMAEEWGVRFLGSMPLDGDGWGMLVEEGRRPVYRKIDAPSEAAAAPEQPHEKDPGTMADKYLDCSLCPLFRKVAEQVVECAGTLPQPPTG